uniref:Uncharacterized protein n=1 Tax=Rhizophora mucronata TaxID=61149 RepID=A0A2P2PX30_RHIMU
MDLFKLSRVLAFLDYA